MRGQGIITQRTGSIQRTPVEGLRLRLWTTQLLRAARDSIRTQYFRVKD
eukprot:CAMPEP_0118866678 /NCGR_PEP_ID=MMETSP1163-20130328/10507_1 /TAXON_ID=124430 /ORGANISM="Phaeomonas parva, Strain CCMP2877" /LENGTH=48 /DNA_ID= /DNA_START= /DNA_END= /DNA_ORIENTATION=